MLTISLPLQKEKSSPKAHPLLALWLAIDTCSATLGELEITKSKHLGD
jgi:hypothetical protein